MKLFLQIALGLLIGFLSMWWAIRDTDFSDVMQYLHQVRPQDMLLVAMLFMLQQILRAHRQTLLLPQLPMNKSLLVLCIGFFFINTLPARLGEFARPILLKEQQDIPLSTSLAMVVTERLLDLASAFLLAIAFLSFAHIPQLDETWATRISVGAKVALPLSLICLYIGIGWGKEITQKLPSSLATKASLFLLSMAAHKKHMPSILLSTFLIWGMTPLLFIAGGWSFSLDLSYIQGVGLLGFSMLGMAAPNAPGFAGTYEASIMAGLNVIGIGEESRDFAFAFGFHWWVYGVQSISALYYLATHKISIRSTWLQMRVNSKA